MNPVGLPIVLKETINAEMHRLRRDSHQGHDGQLAPTNTGDVAGVFFERGHNGLLAAKARVFNALERVQDALVILRHDLDELWNHQLPIG